MLKFIPYGDTEIAEGDQKPSPQLLHPLCRPARHDANWQLPAQITVASPEAFVHDGGVVYAANGFPLIYIGIFIITPYNYTLPPAPTR